MRAQAFTTDEALLLAAPEKCSGCQAATPHPESGRFQRSGDTERWFWLCEFCSTCPICCQDCFEHAAGTCSCPPWCDQKAS